MGIMNRLERGVTVPPSPGCKRVLYAVFFLHACCAGRRRQRMNLPVNV